MTNKRHILLAKITMTQFMALPCQPLAWYNHCNEEDIVDTYLSNDLNARQHYEEVSLKDVFLLVGA